MRYEILDPVVLFIPEAVRRAKLEMVVFYEKKVELIILGYFRYHPNLM